MKGRIVKIISNDYTVLSGDNAYTCKSRGKFRNMKLKPLVGDIVIFDEINNYITDILDRKNELIRPPVSNIDQAIIVCSVKRPDFDSFLLDKLLTIIEFNKVKPIIYFSKIDLLNDEEKINIDNYISYYKKFYEVYTSSSVNEIAKVFRDKISVITGQSGAGKSTLLNKLDSNLNIKTDDISLALGRGKHTTRHVELLDLYGGYVADTPGFSSLEFIDMSEIDIRDNFRDFNLYRDLCKYKDCMHDKESECIIKEKVKDGEILLSRYENYIKFINKNRH